ncbi:MAG: hypothetical protein ACFFA5_08485 [Promethearchaeota archaeon]
MERLPASQTTCGVSNIPLKGIGLTQALNRAVPAPTMSPSRPTGLYGIQGSEGYSHADLLPAGRHRSYVCEQLFKNYRDLCESEKVTHFIPPTRWRVFLRRNGILKTIGVFPSCPL